MATKVEIAEKEKLDKYRAYLEDAGYTVTEKGFFRCISTGKELSVKQGNFYQSTNKIFAGCTVDTDDGLIQILPIRKSKIEKMYNEFMIITKKNEKLAIYKLSQELRIPWIEGLWEMANASKVVSWKFYIGKFNSLHQYNDVTFEDSEEYCGDMDDLLVDHKDLEIKKPKVRKRDKKVSVAKWGNFSDADLRFLDDEYDDWALKYTLDTKSLVTLIKEICQTQLSIRKARENGEAVTKLLKDLQDLMNSSALKPIQESAAMSSEANTLGVWIKKIENEEPIKEVDDDYKDVDGIGYLIRVFFLGHFNKMLGIKNDLSEEYEREMAKYTVKLEDGDE